jgi:hypothetical protein
LFSYLIFSFFSLFIFFVIDKKKYVLLPQKDYEALQKTAAGSNDPFYKAKLQTARFYFARLFPETASLMLTARSGSDVLMDTEEVFF